MNKNYTSLLLAFLLLLTVSSNFLFAQTVTYNKLIDFNGTLPLAAVGNNGQVPYCSLIEGSDGKLYGTTQFGTLGGLAFSINKDGTGYQKLIDFPTAVVGNDGVNPRGSFIEGSDGKLYGMTQTGGSVGQGTAFSINKDGTGYQKLIDFNGTLPLLAVGNDGQQPYGSFIEGSDGKLYGMTYSGGSAGVGIGFRIDKNGSNYEKIIDFNGTLPLLAVGNNGQLPHGSFIEGSDGKLYGMTQQGGGAGAGGPGIAFRIDKNGSNYQKLITFGNFVPAGNTGRNPYGSFIESSDGKLYGMTQAGGSATFGIAFSINKDGTGYQKFIDFNGTLPAAAVGNNGREPWGSFIESGGKLYGMTFGGGSATRGIAFRIDKDGLNYEKLIDFNGTLPAAAVGNNGQRPRGSFIKGSDGNFYGITEQGGSASAGIVFSLTFGTTVTNVTATTADGTYKIGDNIDITVTFTGNVAVTGTPQLTLGTTPTNRIADYLSGTGTNTLTFRYTVQATDVSADLDYLSTTALALNGGTMSGAILTLPAVGGAGSLGANRNIVIEGVRPTVTSIVRQTPTTATVINNASVVYRVTFSEAVTGVDVTDFALTATLTAAGTVASVATVSTTVYDVTVNTITGAGTLRLDVATVPTVNDVAGNALTAAFTTGEVYTIDRVLPTVASITRQTPTTATPINNTTVVYRVTFSEAVANVDVTDFILTTTSTANGTIASVSAATGTSIDVTVNTITGAGTLRLDVPNTATVVDLAANALTAAFATGEVYTIDNVLPTAASILRQTPTTATVINNASVVYRATFSEAVTGVDVTDFTLTATLTATGTIASVATVSTTEYDVTVNTITGAGTLRLDVPNTATVNDLATNALTAAFNTGEVYLIDRVLPTATNIVRQNPTTATTINNASVTFRLTFDKIVKNVDITDFILTTTGTANGTIASVSAATGTSIDVTVNGISGLGTLRLDIPLVNTINDDAGNITAAFTTGQVYTIDRQVPTATSMNRLTPTTATVINNTTVVFRVTFDKTVKDVDINDDFILTKTGTANGTITAVSATTGTVIDVTVSGITGLGTLRLDIPPANTINDNANNNAAAFTAGQVYTIDRVVPTATSIVRQSPTTATTINNADVTFRLTFDKTVKNVDVADFILTKTGTANGTIASVSATTGTSIDVTVNGISGVGTLRLDIPIANTINDDANNIAAAFTTGQIYTIDRQVPIAISIVRLPPTTTAINNTTVVYRVTFDKTVKNVDIADFILTKTGTANGTIASVSATMGTFIDVTVNGISGVGTLRLDIPLTNTINDDGNNITAAFTTGQVYTTGINTAPTDIALTSNAIEENKPANSEVGTFSTTDPEAGNTFTYTFAAGGADNDAFNILGNKLRINAPFDFEKKNSYSIRVRTTDQGGLSVEKNITIDVINVLETPNAPQFVNAQAGSGQITLTWSENPNAVRYEIYMYSANSPQQLVGVTNQTTFTVVGLQNTNTYFFRIVAFGTDGSNSDFSNPVSARPSVVLGTEEETASSLFQVYPNPSNGNLTLKANELKGKNATISVLDMSGRVVFSQALQTNGSVETELNLNLSNGVYLLHISTEKDNLKRKLVVQK